MVNWYIKFFEKKREAFYSWLAWKLPKRVAMWAAVRVGAHATTGKYSSQIVPKLTFLEALNRWEHEERI